MLFLLSIYAFRRARPAPRRAHHLNHAYSFFFDAGHNFF